jgi:hypothetical protein
MTTEQTNTDVIQVNPKEFGLEESKATELLSNLPTIKKEREILESQYNDIIVLDIEDPVTAKKARSLRLLIKDNRTKGISIWHKNAKEFFLRGGQFVDAIRRKEEAVNISMEEKLEEIEKYQEIKEQQRIDALRVSRMEEISAYVEFVPAGIDLGTLNDASYKSVFDGAKMQYEAKIEAERKAEEEAKEQQRIIKLNLDRKELLIPYWKFVPDNIKSTGLGTLTDDEFDSILFSSKAANHEYEKEQEKVRKEKEEAERLLAQERAIAEAKKKEHEAELEKQRLEAELKAAKEREKIERERKEAEEKANQERLEKEKVEAELRRIKEEEERQKKEAELLKKKQAAAPDIEKLKAWVDSVELPSIEINTPELKSVKEEIESKFLSFKTWANNQIKNHTTS